MLLFTWPSSAAASAGAAGAPLDPLHATRADRATHATHRYSIGLKSDEPPTRLRCYDSARAAANRSRVLPLGVERNDLAEQIAKDPALGGGKRLERLVHAAKHFGQDRTKAPL